MKQITDAEQELNIHVTNKSVKNLMNLYQKAIEYYSALDNKCFEDFLNRMTNLFKREDIQKALAQPDEEVKKEEEPASDKNDNTNEKTEIQNQTQNTEGSEKDELLDA